MSTEECQGYHWSQGQYVLSDCTQESSTFFIILGFTMIILILLLFIVVVISCLRRRRNRAFAPQNIPLAPRRGDDNYVVDIDGIRQTGGPNNGRNVDYVKCVINPGEEKPTFIAHPSNTAIPSLPTRRTELEPNNGETSKQPDPGVT